MKKKKKKTINWNQFWVVAYYKKLYTQNTLERNWFHTCAKMNYVCGFKLWLGCTPKKKWKEKKHQNKKKMKANG